MSRKKVFYCLLVLFTSLMMGACNRAPDAIDSTGKPIKLSEYKGKWVVINYWASWCAPCLRELPELDKLAQTKSNQLVVLGVNFDGQTKHDIQIFGNSLDLHFPLLSQFPKEKWGINDIPVLPTTFLISPAGKLVTTLQGPQTQASLLKAMQL